MKPSPTEIHLYKVLNRYNCCGCNFLSDYCNYPNIIWRNHLGSIANSAVTLYGTGLINRNRCCVRNSRSNENIYYKKRIQRSHS